MKINELLDRLEKAFPNSVNLKENDVWFVGWVSDGLANIVFNVDEDNDQDVVLQHNRLRSIILDIESCEEEKSMRAFELAHEIIESHNLTHTDLDLIIERGNNRTADEKELIQTMREILSEKDYIGDLNG